MITIFCDFRQFLAKKLALFSKNNAMIKNLHNLALFRVKNANFFAEIFGENILKIITSVPGHTYSRLAKWAPRQGSCLGSKFLPSPPSKHHLFCLNLTQELLS
jgi:hypothetical protein